jgi:hypothetical protein
LLGGQRAGARTSKKKMVREITHQNRRINKDESPRMVGRAPSIGKAAAAALGAVAVAVAAVAVAALRGGVLVAPASPASLQQEDPNYVDEGCVDEHVECEAWAGRGECLRNPAYMAVACRRACDGCLNATEAAQLARSGCEDEEPDQCEAWAVQGECGANPNYMLTGCARACGVCHLLVPSVRCRVLYSSASAAAVAMQEPPLSLDNVFRRSLTDFEHLKPTILSDGGANGGKRPWIVSFDAFASDEEVADILAAAEAEGFSRSTLPPDVEKPNSLFGSLMGSDGEAAAAAAASAAATMRTSESESDLKRSSSSSWHGVAHRARTSATAWCQSGACTSHPSVDAVSRRIAAVAGGLPVENQEYLQVLRYREGEFYEYHDDYVDEHASAPFGPRLLTVFLYLSDDFEGGETRFTKLGLSVTPRRGRAVMWPSVVETTTEEQKEGEGGRRSWTKDGRTTHEAREVRRGTKYGANAWIHSGNFRERREGTFFANGC